MKYYTSKQLAAQLGVQLSTIRQWVRRGKLQGTKVGDRWLFTKEQIKSAGLYPTFVRGQEEI